MYLRDMNPKRLFIKRPMSSREIIALECVFMTLVLTALFYVRSTYQSNLTIGTETLLFGISFGLIHICSANVMCRLYNQSDEMMPKFLRSDWTVKKSRKVGAICIVLTLLGYLQYLLFG